MAENNIMEMFNQGINELQKVVNAEQRELDKKKVVLKQKKKARDLWQGRVKARSRPKPNAAQP